MSPFCQTSGDSIGIVETVCGRIRPVEFDISNGHDRMVTSEAARHALYAELEQVLGTEHADTLMTSLPMEQAGQLATKTDIDRLDDVNSLDQV